MAPGCSFPGEHISKRISTLEPKLHILRFGGSRSSNKMPAAVKEAVAFAAEKCGGMTSEDAQEYIEEMEKTGRLIEECWS